MADPRRAPLMFLPNADLLAVEQQDQQSAVPPIPKPSSVLPPLPRAIQDMLHATVGRGPETPAPIGAPHSTTVPVNEVDVGHCIEV